MGKMSEALMETELSEKLDSQLQHYRVTFPSIRAPSVPRGAFSSVAPTKGTKSVEYATLSRVFFFFFQYWKWICS